MSPRTETAPPNDRGMWRRLVARIHPDAGGDHELFIWTGAVRDMVCSLERSVPRGTDSHPPRREPPRRPEPSASPEPDRVPFAPDVGFDDLTARAMASGSSASPLAVFVLMQLEDCHESADEVLVRQQMRGATYKQLAAIAHMMGMSKAERVRWYRIAERIPLSQRHAGHILGKLKREAAA